MPDRLHGSEPRGLANTPRAVSYDGRFGRMFQRLPAAHDPQADAPVLREVAAAMRETSDAPSGDNPDLPAGYTYLGQFVDHDITFDPNSALQRRNDPEGLLNFRTPRFDLDSVYGSGPHDEPFQYDPQLEDGFGLLIVDRGGSPDLPRVEQRGRRALIGDPRNDENGIVSQLHLAFLAFHNAVLRDLAGQGRLAGQELFDAAQQTAQWHYQWVVVHDYLRRVLGDDLHRRLLVQETDADGTVRDAVRLRHYRHKRNPYLPVEFSVAAYRFGHSQVRNEYNINGSFRRPIFSANGDDFRGFQPVRPGWHASWPFFFELDGQAPQPSRLIDTKLAAALFALPGAAGADDADLALRNLRRGAALGLPSGQAVAAALGVPPLPDAELQPAPPGNAPLWFYVLKEADLGGGRHLGEVGGRIVGETILGLLRADPQSYLQLDPAWTPTLRARGGGPRAFDMVDLLQAAVPNQCRRF